MRRAPRLRQAPSEASPHQLPRYPVYTPTPDGFERFLWACVGLSRAEGALRACVGQVSSPVLRDPAGRDHAAALILIEVVACPCHGPRRQGTARRGLEWIAVCAIRSVKSRERDTNEQYHLSRRPCRHRPRGLGVFRVTLTRHEAPRAVPPPAPRSRVEC
jgi:hypothetical protein